VLFFVWPLVYNGLILVGENVLSIGAVGAGIYAFLNRLLIPIGMHHALNAVFWFDVAGISDLTKFWSSTGEYGVTGMYMTGFFPVMMFGVPAAAFAMYRCAKPERRKAVLGLLASAAFCSFFTGVTEPLEFSFMFLAPGLYVLYAFMTGITAMITVMLPIRAGFSFSAGFLDLFFSSQMPLAQNPWFVIPVGLVVFVVFFFVFRYAILHFDLKTPGREDEDRIPQKADDKSGNKDYALYAQKILVALGGKDNIVAVDNCITRIRLDVLDSSIVDDAAIKAAGASGVLRPSAKSVQVIVGTQVQFVTDELKKLLEK
ncbi:MAG: PTS transporter subunit EIIC, partial [Candidatus Anaerobiospirillum merdipullorum]|nr:PTS transporter subunit EIIC [Candidatus Anaerobiospirillum merdipullorum]